MRSHARVVVVGGGMMGAGLLYHLAKEGWSDALLVEKAELTSGSTWHAAGQCTHSVSGYSLAKIHDYGIRLYPQLEAETGQSVSWHRSGSLRVAYRDVEVDWIRSQLGVARYVGYPMELVGPAEIARLHPFYDTTGIRAAAYTPDDGHLDPAGACQALAKGARQMGAGVVRRNRVLAIRRRGRGGASGEWEVVTEQGSVVCEHVVNAAGCYASQVGAMAGVAVPVANVLHHYLVTDTVPEFAARDTELPVVRDDGFSGYVRQEQQSGLIGIYEQEGATAAWRDGCPWEAEHELFEADLDAIGPWLERALARVPVLAERGIKRIVRGAITHTPDGHMLLGPAPGLENFWLACGAQIGIAWGAGAGRYLAHWIVHGAPEINLRPFDPRRFGPWADARYVVAKSTEDYEFRHRTPVPGLERPAARPVRASALFDRLCERGAVHTQIAGWERPKWFVPAGAAREDVAGFRRVEWFDTVGEECRAVRERVGLFDLSAFAKIEVRGAGAAEFLDRLLANRLPRRDGGMALAHMLTGGGCFETEVTVTRLAPDRYYLVSSALGEIKDVDWLIHHRRPGEQVEIENVSDAFGCLMIAGPRSRDLLARGTNADLGNDAFRWLTAQEIAVLGASCRALRVSYTGELGWELHVPMERMPAVYDGLASAGTDLGVADFGSHALNSLRMEKAYRGGTELTQEVGPVEADMMRFVALDKGDFLGRDAVRERCGGNGAPARWRLAYLEVDATVADCMGGEAVLAADRPVGLACSGGYGYATGKSLAFAYVAPEHAAAGSALEVLVLGDPRPARVLADAAWDPASERPRA